MKTQKYINTLDAIDFRKAFIEEDSYSTNPFRANLDQFFCSKIEEFKFIKLPIPPTKQINHTILFISSGNHKIKVGFKLYNVGANELIIIPAGQIYSIESVEKDLSGFVCHFSYEFLMGKYSIKEMLQSFDFLKIWNDSYFKLTQQDAEFFTNLFNRLHFEDSSNTLLNMDIVQPYLITLLCEINNKFKTKTDRNYSAAAILVVKFKELIYSQKQVKRKIDFYASKLHVTPNHLNKSVKLVTGKTSSKWIDEVILMEAKYLLSQTSLDISEISIQLGYNDQSYFSRLFKKYEGFTPIEYRKMIE